MSRKVSGFIRGNVWILALSARVLQRLDCAETSASFHDCGAAIIESQSPARPRRRPSVKLSTVPLRLHTLARETSPCIPDPSTPLRFATALFQQGGSRGLLQAHSPPRPKTLADPGRSHGGLPPPPIQHLLQLQRLCTCPLGNGHHTCSPFASLSIVKPP